MFFVVMEEQLHDVMLHAQGEIFIGLVLMFTEDVNQGITFFMLHLINDVGFISTVMLVDKCLSIKVSFCKVNVLKSRESKSGLGR